MKATLVLMTLTLALPFAARADQHPPSPQPQPAPIPPALIVDAHLSDSSEQIDYLGECMKSQILKQAAAHGPAGAIGNILGIKGPDFLKDKDGYIVDDRVAEYRIPTDKKIEDEQKLLLSLRIKTANNAPWHMYEYGIEQIGMFAYRVSPNADLVDTKTGKLAFVVDLSPCRRLMQRD